MNELINSTLTPTPLANSTGSFLSVDKIEKGTAVQISANLPYSSEILRELNAYSIEDETLNRNKFESIVYEAREAKDCVATTEECLESIDKVALALLAYESSDKDFATDSNFSNYLGLPEDTLSEAGRRKGVKVKFNYTHNKGRATVLVRRLQELGFNNIKLTQEGAIIDEASGLRCVIVDNSEEPGTINIGFGGTNSGTGGWMTYAQTVADVGQFFGWIPESYSQASEIVRIISELSPEKNISVVGHSLGGGLSQYAVLKNSDGDRIMAYCFNSAAISRAAQADIASKLKDASRTIKHIGIDGDPVSSYSHWTLAQGDRFLNSVGICTPANFGTRRFVRHNLDENQLCFITRWFYAPLDAHKRYDRDIVSAALAA